MFCRIVAAVLVTILGAAPLATAQIPDEFTNLQILPEDIGKRDLMNVMRNMAGALGQRCQFCHVAGEDPNDLSGFDFASDENHHKDIARTMMKMTSGINETLAANVESPLRVTCVTCHHGVKKPEQMEDILVATAADGGAEAAQAKYVELRAEYYGRASYDFSPGPINGAAESLADGNLADAVALMEMNVEYHPEDAYAHLLLGRLYAANDQKDQAVAAIERSLELEPDNAWAKRILEQVKAGGDE